MLRSLVCLVALGSAAAAAALVGPPAAGTEVYRHGEGGFRCIRIPSTLALPHNILLSFAAARSFTGDSCYPTRNVSQPKPYSAAVVKRSTDGGATFGPIVEILRGSDGPKGHVSPEGASFWHSATGTALTIVQTDKVSNATEGLRLFQSQSTDAGLSWSAAAPLNIPRLLRANVTAGTHIAPDNGIELQAGKHKGRLLHVLILKTGNVLDVVIYSDDVGKTWEMSETPLPHNGESSCFNRKLLAIGSRRL